MNGRNRWSFLFGVQIDSETATAEELMVHALHRQKRWWGGISLAMIAVSFVHMVASLAMFSGDAWYEMAAVAGMTIMVDVVTWRAANYFDFARRVGLERSPWSKALFVLALLISFVLNFIYLDKYAKLATNMEGWAMALIPFAFACFVPGTIGITAVITGELDDHELKQREGSAHQRTKAIQPVAVPVRAPRSLPRSVPRSLPDDTSLPASDVPSSAFGSPNEAPFAETAPASPVPLQPPSLPTLDLRVDGPISEGTGNAKALISTKDVTAVAEAMLREGNPKLYANATLNRMCGWSSPGSGKIARDALREAGWLHEGTDEGGSYFMLREATEAEAGAEAREASA